MNNELKAQLKRVIVHELDLKDFQPEDIGDDDILFGDKFGLDSIDAVELVFQVKMHFGVEIRDMKEGRPALQSVNALSQYIHQRLGQ
ncbi:MAG: phosphopantetheine-binding protein [Desulfovermiculus sp.]